jgi:hypothetical protein
MLIHFHWFIGIALCFPLLVGAFEQGKFPPSRRQVFRYYVYYIFTFAMNVGYYIHLAIIWSRLESRMPEIIGSIAVGLATVFLLALKPWKGQRKESDHYSKPPRD